MTDYFFGELPGHPVGSAYENRKLAAQAGVHQVLVQGIAGNRAVGCSSIVLNGGYDTDEDYGHEIFYTGAGGQDPQNRKRHIADQDLNVNDNAALLTSEETGRPIRIVRGWKAAGEHSPSSGYRYDGLYKVVKHYQLTPPDGFRRWMFHLVQLDAIEARAYTPAENLKVNARVFAEQDLGSGSEPREGPRPAAAANVDPFFDAPVEVLLPVGKAEPGVRVVATQRVIRDTKVTAAVKAMYEDSCQVCDARIATSTTFYSEGAHIRPLGRPHHGADTLPNILCLCPNHHAAFDKGGIYIDEEWLVRDVDDGPVGKLRVHPAHAIDANFVAYHRAHHRRQPAAQL